MLKKLYSKKMDTIKISTIGVLLASTRSEDFISFAAGVPARDLYLVDPIQKVINHILQEEGNLVLGYNDTPGDPRLRELLGERTGSIYGFSANKKNVLITSGSTQCIDILGRLFFNPSDRVLTEDVTYIDAKNSMAFNGAELVGIPCDNEGMDLTYVKEELDKGAKAIYIIPDFQNPTGRTWSIKRRKAFMNLVNQYDVLVIEDNPYGEIYFEGAPMPSLKSMDKKDQVIFLCSASKVFCPGLRIGWLIGPESLIEDMNSVKEKCDLHSSSLDQAILRRLLETPLFNDNIVHLREVYHERAKNMVSALKTYLPECTYEVPKGGFFIWVRLPDGMSGMAFLDACLAEKVAFVPGNPFSSRGNMDQYIRIAFPGVTKELAEEGVCRMAKALKKLKGSV